MLWYAMEEGNVDPFGRLPELEELLLDAGARAGRSEASLSGTNRRLVALMESDLWGPVVWELCIATPARIVGIDSEGGELGLSDAP